jgi:hypothetical protein
MLHVLQRDIGQSRNGNNDTKNKQLWFNAKTIG